MEDNLRCTRTAAPLLGVVVLFQQVGATQTLDLIAPSGFGCLLEDRVLVVDDSLAPAECLHERLSPRPHVVATLLA